MGAFSPPIPAAAPAAPAPATNSGWLNIVFRLLAAAAAAAALRRRHHTMKPMRPATNTAPTPAPAPMPILAPEESPLSVLGGIGVGETEDEVAADEEVGDGPEVVNNWPLIDITVSVAVDVTVVVLLALSTTVDVRVDSTTALLVEVTTLRTV